MRWGSLDKGKRGGVRAIYRGQLAGERIWLLAVYATGRQQTLPAHIIRAIKEQLVEP